MSYGTAYIDIPELKTRKGGKDIIKMSKSTNTAEAVKPAKKYQKSRGEHAKDILIAVLLTGMIAFVGGMTFANRQQAEVKSAVTAAQQAMAPKAEAAAPVAPASK